ncbi:MAG: cation:proton antiporter [Candidatus Aenigmarchaeota archaeon]|nr:cation:proton antiporter [Candidatus Aenigmarchaeota archaeon]
MVGGDAYLLVLVTLSFLALVLGAILRYFRQPSVIAYILTGLILGPFGLKVITDTEAVTSLGNIGVVFLLFFIGLSVSPSELVTRWRIAILGTFFQILLSVLVVWFFGLILGWPMGMIILLGFVISLSSTAVVVKILEARKEVDSKIGQDVLSILIVQDLAVIPMIIVLSLMTGEAVSRGILSLQIFGCLFALAFVLWIMRKREVVLPFSDRFKGDPEMQVLASIVFSLGIASLSEFFHLSAALGAFVAGIFIASTRETRWVQQSLEPFKILFIAIFFMSIGLLIDLKFLASEFPTVVIMLMLVFFTNSFLNALIFKWSGESWRTSLYGGSLLAQIGEFSFVLAAIGLGNQLITQSSYQLVIQVIAISLIIGPFWIKFFEYFIDESEVLIRESRRIAFAPKNYRYSPKQAGPYDALFEAGKRISYAIFDESGNLVDGDKNNGPLHREKYRKRS